jgi:hypothetical protein
MRNVGQQPPRVVEATQRLWLVQWRHLHQFTKPPLNRVVDDHRVDEVRSAVDDAVPDRVDIGGLGGRPVVGGDLSAVGDEVYLE